MVGLQTQGEIEDAYCGHWQMSGVRVDDEMGVPSVQLTAVAPLPK